MDGGGNSSASANRDNNGVTLADGYGFAPDANASAAAGGFAADSHYRDDGEPSEMTVDCGLINGVWAARFDVLSLAPNRTIACSADVAANDGSASATGTGDDCAYVAP